MIPSHYSINRSDAVAILRDQDEKYMSGKSGKSGITVSHHITQKSASTAFPLAIFTTRSHCLPRPTFCAEHGRGAELMVPGAQIPGLNCWANRRHPRSENCMLQLLDLLDCSTAIDTMHVSMYKRFGTYNNPRVLATYIYESSSCDNAILSLSLTKLGWTCKL